MALVRGVICLSLSDWAPAVAPSLAPLRALLGPPLAPHLSQMGGGGVAGGQGRGGEDGKSPRKSNGLFCSSPVVLEQRSGQQSER